MKVFSYRAELGQGYGLVELLEIFSGADVDALQADLLVKHGSDGEGYGFDSSTEHSDLGDSATDAQRAQRARQSGLAAYLDHQIDSLARGFVHGPAVPLRAFFVIEAGIEAERIGAFKLFKTAGYAEDARAAKPGQLKGKYRDATGSLDQDCVAGLNIAHRKGVPRGDSGAGQCGSFLKAEVLGNGHQSGFLEDHIFGQHAVDVAAKRASRFFGTGRPVKPVLHEDGGHAVAGVPGSHAVTYGHNFSGSIGDRDARKFQFWVVYTLDDHQIAVVERDRTDLDQHFSGPGRRGGPLHKL